MRDILISQGCFIIFRPSHFKDCVATAMCLIVTLFSISFQDHLQIHQCLPSTSPQLSTDIRAL